MSREPWGGSPASASEVTQLLGNGLGGFQDAGKVVVVAGAGNVLLHAAEADTGYHGAVHLIDRGTEAVYMGFVFTEVPGVFLLARLVDELQQLRPVGDGGIGVFFGLDPV